MKQPIERFLAFVLEEDATGCWLWQGSKGHRGYGEFFFNRKLYRAHRWSFEHFSRPLNAGEVVCHRCDVPSCVNPAHLFAGSQSDNLLDAVAKGRKPIREKSAAYRGVVTVDIVRQIRQRRASGESNKSIAERFKVSPAYCSTIARGIHWPEVVA